jgi:hypothetical protein
MKYTKQLLLAFAATVCCLPPLSYANGDYTPGTVVVSGNNITAAYNVRYNPGVARGRFDFYVVNNLVYAAGVDSSTGAGFSCYANTSNPVYPMMKAAAYGAGNGAVVYVARFNGTAVCSSITYRKASNSLD